MRGENLERFAHDFLDLPYRQLDPASFAHSYDAREFVLIDGHVHPPVRSTFVVLIIFLRSITSK
jgi:hypothetical protein